MPSGHSSPDVTQTDAHQLGYRLRRGLGPLRAGRESSSPTWHRLQMTSCQGWGSGAAGRPAISLWKEALLCIWTNLNGTGTEGLCEMCLWNSCDRYPCKACVYKWECVRRRALRGLLGAPFLTLINTYSQSLTGELEANICIQTVLGPLTEGSFTRSVRCKYIHQTMLLHREGAIKTHFRR